MSASYDRVLQAYIQKHNGRVPEDPQKLVAFSHQDEDLPHILYSEAQKALSKIKSAIKTKPKQSSKWRVGDEVLISKDRTGILKYIGPVPEMGDDPVYYGLELTSGTIGQNDGAIKGRRYFYTDPKRGMFIPERKLRRRLNRKDHQRKDSYRLVSNNIQKLRREYSAESSVRRGSEDSRDNRVPSASPDPRRGLEYSNSPVQPPRAYNAEEIQSMVNELQPPNGLQSRKSQSFVGDRDRDRDRDRDVRREPGSKKKKKKKSSKARRKRTESVSSTDQSSAREQREQRHYGKISRNTQYSDDDNEEEEETEEESEMSDLNDENQSGRERAVSYDNAPTVKTFDTLLKYILRQKGQYREGLLDVYANPQTHPLIVAAFSDMKQLKPAEQTFLWPALLRRWSKYCHRI